MPARSRWRSASPRTRGAGAAARYRRSQDQDFGCINACGHHHVGHIGILGVDKNGVELYQLSLGGDVDFGQTAIGTSSGRP
jgi:sulfite reductase beta subunit-like hemoprotein